MNTILISIIAIPIIEILLFIKIGENIGAINTILLIIFTAIVGVYFARIQGIKTIKSGFINIYQNKLPIYEILSGASIAIAAVLLIIPGFFTDTIGFLLLIPITRKILLSPIINKSKNQTKNNKTIEAEIIEEKKKMNYKIIAKYIKKLDFDISKPDKFFSLTKDISNYKFKIDIKSNRFKDNIIEVQTTLVLEPKDKNFR